MKKIVYILTALLLLGGVALAAYSPDAFSMIFVALMLVVSVLGLIFGVLPVMQFNRGLQNGRDSIARVAGAQSGSAWAVLAQSGEVFHQGKLDAIFDEYADRVQAQRETGSLLSDVGDYVNEENLALHSWQNLVMQVPGTLTGLGILGTFLGLMIGIRGIGFSSVSAALTSVQTLLTGIEMAFYTSIAGVILSLMFNILYRLAWNLMARTLGLFTDEFHKSVIPTAEEQARGQGLLEMKQIARLLENMPRSQGSLPGAAGAGGQDSEQTLMPQILQGLQQGEFVFYLQPRFDLNSRKMTGAEVLVRWNHAELGRLSPSVFVPLLERNGYITKLDQYIWESVCASMRQWIDAGLRPVPLSINVTKTDILAMDVVQVFSGLLEKYQIPPRSLEIEIAEGTYLQCGQAVTEAEQRLRQLGFRVVVDDFGGDFLALTRIPEMKADALKLDLRGMENNRPETVREIFDQAKKLHVFLSAEGIESMEQLNLLRKCGCAEGQGFYLSKPVSQKKFEKLLSEGNDR